MTWSCILRPNNQSIHSSTDCLLSRCARVCLPREQEQVLVRVEAGRASGQCLAEAIKYLVLHLIGIVSRITLRWRKDHICICGTSTAEAGCLIRPRLNSSTRRAVVGCMVNPSVNQPICSMARMRLRLILSFAKGILLREWEVFRNASDSKDTVLP